MLVQLNKCGSDLQRGHSSDRCLSSSNSFKYERSMGHLFVLSWNRVRWVALGECCLRVMYGEWYFVPPHVVDVSSLSICIVLCVFWL